jgi:hypothetical protein
MVRTRRAASTSYGELAAFAHATPSAFEQVAIAHSSAGAFDAAHATRRDTARVLERARSGRRRALTQDIDVGTVRVGSSSIRPLALHHVEHRRRRRV